MRKRKGNFWPSGPQELLLVAGLEDAPVAVAAWDRWLTVAGETEFDVGSQRLAPLVFTNLSRFGVRHPELARFKGLYRRAWYQNQLLLRRAAEVIDHLHRYGIPTLMLKGIPLSLGAYGDMGARPMTDIDLAVPRRDAVAASRLLLEQGWTLGVPVERIRPEWQVAATFRAPDGVELDLHFSVFHECLDGAGTEATWARAREIDIGGVGSLAPCAEDQLLHTIAHGIRSNPVPPIRWVADAVRLMRAGKPLDWAILVDQASAVRLTFAVGQAMTYLSATFDCVPDELLDPLSRHRVSLVERFEYAIGRERRTPWLHPVHYVRSAHWTERRGYLLGVFPFLRGYWGEASIAATVGHLSRGAARRCREMVSARLSRRHEPVRAGATGTARQGGHGAS